MASFSECTTCQKCVKECPDEAISMAQPSSREFEKRLEQDHAGNAALRRALSDTIKTLAIQVSDKPVAIPAQLTAYLIPRWDDSRCIGCRECELDVCPYSVITQTLSMRPKHETADERAFLRMNPQTAGALGLSEGEFVRVESKDGFVDPMRLEITEDVDPRIVWASDGWWNMNGNINYLTDDKHTAFGSTPGFNSVLVRVTKSVVELNRIS